MSSVEVNHMNVHTVLLNKSHFCYISVAKNFLLSHVQYMLLDRYECCSPSHCSHGHLCRLQSFSHQGG